MPYANKEELRAYQREWRRKRREEWIKEHGPCVDCGGSENLEIDHIDASEKEHDVSDLWSRKKEIREKELAKCCVRCRECHLRKTLRCGDTVRNGEDHASSKLTNETVLEIRRLRAEEGISYRKLAARFDLAYSHVAGIIKRTRWSHI